MTYAKEESPTLRSFGIIQEAKGNVTVATNNRGDVEAGFKQADQIIEYDFNMPAFCGHMPNPSASAAYWYDDPMQSSEQKSLHLEGAVQRKDSVGGMYGLPLGKGKTGRPFPGRQILRLGHAENTGNHAAARQKDGKTGPHDVHPKRDVRLQYEPALHAPEGRV